MERMYDAPSLGPRPCGRDAALDTALLEGRDRAEQGHTGGSSVMIVTRRSRRRDSQG